MANVPEVAAWFTGRGYLVHRPRSNDQALSAFHPAYLDRIVTRPGDILICDQTIGRVWKG